MSSTATRGVRVTVEPRFHPERSNPTGRYWFFSYTVEIANEGDETVRLLKRHWIITDGTGHVESVEGPGVVGETPILRPGESFRYTSFCPLSTSLGSMHGTYGMKTAEGAEFEAKIDPFVLEDPETIN
jgi:ApaG protein